MSASAKCIVCTRFYCERVFVYVMQDHDRGDVKIGISWHPTKRVVQLRKSRGTRISVVAKRAGGCRYTAADVEEAVQRRVGVEHRTTGDWFAISPEEAVRALHAEIPVEWAMP